MTSDEIRERYLSFFEERGHLRIPSASLVPSAHDPSALLTVAGMHPLKPYFLGQEVPPAPRLTSCQKVFRTVDIDNVGNTARHLTFFEMLGNFSFGDYFKREAIAFAWELSREVFGFREQDIWVTVFEGDEELGLGPDEEAIECWVELGMPRERIVECPRSENFWQAGPTGPCGPCSELYLDRGPAYGSDTDRPGRRDRALPGVLEPGVHAVRPAPLRRRFGQRAAAAAGEQHRHRPRAQSHGRDPAGEAVRVRDRPVHAADRTRRGALRHRLRGRVRERPRPAGARRPRPREHVPDRRRRRSLQRGPRLRPAQGDAARHPPGPRARARARLHGPLRTAGGRGDGTGLPGTARTGRRDRHVAGRRGGELRAHPRPGHPDARRGGRARAGVRRQGALGRGGVPPARHLRASVRHDPRAVSRRGPLDRGRLRRADGGPARARPGGNEGRGRGRRHDPRPRGRQRLRDRGRIGDGLHRL